ncbi:MAG TPA: winged helix DNA-binding domain-containing protein, partial [Propionibacteriaceae bacterium]|nr:winged helix DNA-binding domain-containing protein [Propionibacteriaceae bacterium]
PSQEECGSVSPKSTTPASLSWNGVTARRMARHALTEPASDLGPADIAGVLCGAHAQVLSAAEFSIGRRIAGATRAHTQRALWEDRTLVKTFGPRGTVHLLSTADLPMWTGALSALPSSVPAHPEPVRFSAEQAEQVIAVIGDALADTELTIDELTEAIVDRTGPWAGEETMEAFQDRWPRWRQLTSTAAHRGVLCFGPNRGRNVTYTNPHRWLPGFRPDDGEAALRGLVTRYLYAYGPATPRHFARWLAIPPRRAVALFDELAGELESVELDGAPAWTMAGDTATPSQPHRGIRLMPYFDAFVVASQPRERLYPGPAAARGLTPGGQAGNYPVVLVDGVVGGVWHQRRSGRRLAITVEPLGELTATQRRQLEDEVELVGAVMEARPTLTVGTVTVGPHA